MNDESNASPPDGSESVVRESANGEAGPDSSSLEKAGAAQAQGSDAELLAAQGSEPEVVTSAPAVTEEPSQAAVSEAMSEALSEALPDAVPETALETAEAEKGASELAPQRPRSSPPPPPSRRRSEKDFPAVVPANGAGVPVAEAPVAELLVAEVAKGNTDESDDGPPDSIIPVSVVSLASIPPVELRRVLPARSSRGRSAAGTSGMPPSLVEPSRIIEVLGSTTPAFSDQWADEVEDLDESEAHELSDTPVPESVTEELDVDVVEEEASPAPPKRKRKRPPAPPSARSDSAPKVESNARKPWWEEAFSQDFLRAIPILLPRQLGREVDCIEGQLNVARGGRILDLACGAGQHAVELASRGYEVVGFDSSQAQLDWAAELALEKLQKLQFINGDMRTLTYQEAFDGICCWNTSFGYFEEEKNLEVAQRMFAALRPGGRLLLDVINRDYVVAEQPGQTWFEGDGCVCIDDVSIDFITSRMRVKRTMMLTSGKNLECGYSLRLYNLHELGKLLHTVGFKVMKVSGRAELPGVFFGEASPRIIILAAKPTE